MRSPDRRRSLAVCVAIVAAVAGCSSQDDAAAPGQSTAASIAPAASTVAPDQPTPTTPSSDPPRPVIVADGPMPTIAADGGALPATLVQGYATNGGDLLEPGEWRGRFGPSGLPQLTGAGVRLVEGVRRSELLDGSWTVTEEAGWLAMTHDDRDTMLASLRSAAGIDGQASRSASIDQGADCIIDTYAVDAGGVSWQVQGCSYEKFPGLVSLGLSRAGPTTDQPTLVDPTISGVAGELGASVTFVEVHFGEPAPDGSTLRLSARLSTPLGFQAAAAAVGSGTLTGWQSFPGDGSVLLSGPTGATWTLSDGVAVFTWSGRW